MLTKRIRFDPAGLAKQSFALPFGGSTLWYEHLDALGNDAQAALRKLAADLPALSRPSAPSLIAVVLDETRAGRALCGALASALARQAACPRRVVFIGLSAWERRRMRKALRSVRPAFAFAFMLDLEKGKQWLVGQA